MRIWANHMAVHQRRPLASTAVRDCMLHGYIAGDRIGAVNLRKKEVWKICDQVRNISARCVDLHGSGDGVAVVFNDKQHRQFRVGGSVERLPKFAFAG